MNTRMVSSEADIFKELNVARHIVVCGPACPAWCGGDCSLDPSTLDVRQLIQLFINARDMRTVRAYLSITSEEIQVGERLFKRGGDHR